MRIGGIDPARRSGMSVYEDGRLIHSSSTIHTKPGDNRRLYRIARDWFAQWGPFALIVVEDQFCGRFKKAGLSVAKCSQVWCDVAYTDDLCAVTSVQPSEWQSLLKLPRGLARNSEALKAESVKMANLLKQQAGLLPVENEDEADAVIIGLWASTMGERYKEDYAKEQAAKAAKVTKRIKRAVKEAKDTALGIQQVAS